MTIHVYYFISGLKKTFSYSFLSLLLHFFSSTHPIPTMWAKAQKTETLRLRRENSCGDRSVRICKGLIFQTSSVPLITITTMWPDPTRSATYSIAAKMSFMENDIPHVTFNSKRYCKGVAGWLVIVFHLQTDRGLGQPVIHRRSRETTTSTTPYCWQSHT